MTIQSFFEFYTEETNEFLAIVRKRLVHVSTEHEFSKFHILTEDVYVHFVQISFEKE